MSLKQEEATNFHSHQEHLQSLIKRRKQIVDKMTHLNKRRCLLQAQPKNKEEAEGVDQEGQPRKIVKLDSRESIENLAETHPLQKEHRIRSSNSLGSQEQQNETLKKMKEQANIRNRKMFQGLNTYLDKAKSKLQLEKTKRQQTKKIHEKIQEREKQKSEQMLKEQIDRLNNEYNVQQKLKDQNSKQILKIQNLMLLKNYTAYADSIKSFVFTRAQPSISWKPTSSDIESWAKKLAIQREQEIQKKTKKVIESIDKYENKFEYTLYVYQNEEEFYNNLLQSYHISTQNFIKTETEPQICWQPVQPLEGLNSLKLAAKKKTEKVIEAIKKQTQAYYKQKVMRFKERKQKDHHDHEDSHSESHHKQDQD